MHISNNLHPDLYNISCSHLVIILPGCAAELGHFWALPVTAWSTSWHHVNYLKI